MHPSYVADFAIFSYAYAFLYFSLFYYISSVCKYSSNFLLAFSFWNAWDAILCQPYRIFTSVTLPDSSDGSVTGNQSTNRTRYSVAAVDHYRFLSHQRPP